MIRKRMIRKIELVKKQDATGPDKWKGMNE